jgi:kynurenine formamidase
MSREEFDKLYDEVCNWGRWGDDDEKGTLNYLTPALVKKCAALVKTGRQVSMSRPIETTAAADNESPAVHRMTKLYQARSSTEEPQFVSDYLGGELHGNAYSHFDALCHVAYRGRLYNDRPVDLVTRNGAKLMDITQYARGIVGRGVLLDIPRLRKSKWLEPGESVTAEELEEAEKAEGVRLGQGDVLVFRVGQNLRRRELGAWDVEQGRAGLHPGAMQFLHERKVSAFLPDGDGETIPSPVDGVRYPVHALQIASMGLACGDSLQLEDLAKACIAEDRWEFMVAIAPLVIPGGTGSLANPIAVF